MKFLIRLVILFGVLAGTAAWFLSNGALTGSGILQGIGLAAIILVGVIVLGVAWFCFKIYRMVKGAMAGGGGMVARVRLVTAEGDDEGAHANETAALVSHFEALGFQRAGRFRIDELQGLILDALVKPDEEMAAAIYDHPNFPAFYDVTAIDHEGNCFTITTSPLSHADNVPNGSEVKIALGLPVQEAVRRMRAERPEGNWQVLEHDSIVAAIEDAYARSMDHQIRRGTIGHSYVRQIAALSNPKAELTDDMIESAIKQHEAGLRALIDEACIANFLKTHSLPAAEWERARDHVVVVHDRMEITEIKSLIDAHMPDGQEAKLPREPLPPQEMFLKYLEKYRLMGKFKYLGAVESPVPARLFRGPD
ncbi:MAG: hypothetical protein JNM76_00030 [Betaproteobacteria bacterium]|nr:hypothetical protein [Betaproteobacteria bacterium]